MGRKKKKMGGENLLTTGGPRKNKIKGDNSQPYFEGLPGVQEKKIVGEGWG